MKQIAITGVTFYQLLLSPFIKNVFGIQSMCRFSPSCSEYAKRSIKRNGIIKGGTNALSRILRCQPFANI